MSILDVLKDIKSLLRPPVLHSVGVYQPIAAADDYAAEDIVSDHATAGKYWEFDGLVRKNGGSGQLIKAQAMWETTNLTPRFTLYLFNKPPTSTLNDNAVNIAPAVGDWASYEGKIDFTALEDLGGVSESLVTPSTYGNLPIAFTCSEGSKKLYGILVTRDAVTDESANARAAIKLCSEPY